MLKKTMGLLGGADRGICHDEADHRLVRVVFGGDAELVGHDSVLLSSDHVDGVVSGQEGLASEPAPCRQIFRRSRVQRDEA
jgi:hypothetical protein